MSDEKKKLINDEELDQITGGAASFSLNDRGFNPDPTANIGSNMEKIDGTNAFNPSPKGKAL